MTIHSVNPYESPLAIEAKRRIDAKVVIQRLRLPIIGLIVAAIIHIVAMVGEVPIVFVYLYEEVRRHGGHAPFGTLGVTMIAFLVGCLPACIQLISARSAFQAKSLWLCRAAALTACIPFLTPAIFLGIPFGIWAAIVLFMPSTAAAFDQPPVLAAELAEP